MTDRAWMRIVHLITKGDVGGAQSVVYELAAGMRGTHEVEVVSGQPGPITDRLKQMGIPVHTEPSLGRSISLRDDCAAYRGLVRRLALLAPDLVHSHSSKAGFLGRMAARKCGFASVYTAHGWPFQPGAPWTQRVFSFVGEFVAGRFGASVVCVNSADYRRACRGRVAPVELLTLIENGIGDVPESLRGKPGSAGQTLRILMMARFAPPKRQDVAIRAACLLAGDVTLDLVGSGPLLESTRLLATSLDPSGRIVRFTPQTDCPESFYREADVCVLLSDFEGLPMTILEAMRAGLPVLTNRIDAADSLGVSAFGRVVDCRPEAVADALRELRVRRDELPALGASARERYESQFTASRMVSEYELLYRRTLDRTTGTRRTNEP